MNMCRLSILLMLLTCALADDYRTVVLEEGTVEGEKYWNGDYYEFYGIPYATVPKGRDRFQVRFHLSHDI